MQEQGPPIQGCWENAECCLMSLERARLPTPPSQRVDLHLPARHHLTNNFLKFFPPAIMPLETYLEIEFSVAIQVRGFYVGDWNWKMEQEKETERVEVEKLWSRETAEWPCLPPRILNTVVRLIQFHWVHWEPERVLCPAHLVISAWPGDGCATHWLKKF